MELIPEENESLYRIAVALEQIAERLAKMAAPIVMTLSQPSPPDPDHGARTD